MIDNENGQYDLSMENQVLIEEPDNEVEDDADFLTRVNTYLDDKKLHVTNLSRIYEGLPRTTLSRFMKGTIGRERGQEIRKILEEIMRGERTPVREIVKTKPSPKRPRRPHARRSAPKTSSSDFKLTVLAHQVVMLSLGLRWLVNEENEETRKQLRDMLGPEMEDFLNLTRAVGNELMRTRVLEEHPNLGR